MAKTATIKLRNVMMSRYDCRNKCVLLCVHHTTTNSITELNKDFVPQVQHCLIYDLNFN